MIEETIEKDMTPILLKDLGMRYPTEKSKKRYRYGLYQCQYCGKEFEAQTHNIRNGNTISCGCQSTKYRNPHMLSTHRLYYIWAGMKARCCNVKHIEYKNYGARGIKVCDRWLKVENFIEDMYPSYREGLTLDRIDVDGNYEPDNCRWATLNIQQYNTRDLQKNNTSGFRGVNWHKANSSWVAQIRVNYTRIHIGCFKTTLEAGKAYERYVRLNNLEHNFTPALTKEEIEEINKEKVRYEHNINS